MKRSALPPRRHPLARRKALRSTPKPIDRSPERAEWKSHGAGYCENCGAECLHLERHHVVALSLIYRDGRNDMAWDLRNGILICERCHSNHTWAFRRIPVERLSDDALAFAVDFFGSDELAADYLRREYGAGRGTGP